MGLEESKINNSILDLFHQKVLKYGFEQEISCHELYYTLKGIVFQLKDEISSNAILLSENGQMPYLMGVKFKMDNLYQQLGGIDSEQIHDYFIKYNCDEYVAFNYFESNILSCILFEPLLTKEGEKEMTNYNWPDNSIQIQNDFWSYAINKHIQNIIDFIQEYKSQLESSKNKTSNINDFNRANTSSVKSDYALNKFIGYIEYNYPEDRSPYGLFLFLNEYVEYLKNEIFENLIKLPQETKKTYLNKIIFQIREHYAHIEPKYEIEAETISKENGVSGLEVFTKETKNILSTLLKIEPNELTLVLSEQNPIPHNYPANAEHIQYVFWQYVIKVHCDVMFGFIDEQLTELTPKEAKKEKEVIVEPMKTDYQIRNEHLIYMLKYLEYTYPYQYCPCSFFYQLKDSIPYLKTEVYNNLVTLSEAGKTPYLNNIKYQLGRKYEEIDQNTLEYVEKYKNEYNVQDYDMYNFGYQNGLLKVLSEEPKELEKRFLKPHLYDDELPKEADSMQLVFWHYAIKVHCETVFDFVDEQLNLLAPNTKTETKPTITKIDTTLTVPQLAYLFRALVDEKLITPKQKTDLFKAVTEIFKTKATESISPDSFKNKYDAPESKAIEFWQEKFTHLMQKAKKEKSKEN